MRRWSRIVFLLILGVLVLPAVAVERAFCAKCPLDYPSDLEVCAGETCEAEGLSDICPLCASPVHAAVPASGERPLPVDADGAVPSVRRTELLPSDIFHPPPAA